MFSATTNSFEKFSSITDPFGHGEMALRLFAKFEVLDNGVKLVKNLIEKDEIFIEGQFKNKLILELLLGNIWDNHYGNISFQWKW